MNTLHIYNSHTAHLYQRRLRLIDDIKHGLLNSFTHINFQTFPLRIILEKKSVTLLIHEIGWSFICQRYSHLEFCSQCKCKSLDRFASQMNLSFAYKLLPAQGGHMGYGRLRRTFSCQFKEAITFLFGNVGVMEARGLSWRPPMGRRGGGGEVRTAGRLGRGGRARLGHSTPPTRCGLEY